MITYRVPADCWVFSLGDTAILVLKFLEADLKAQSTGADNLHIAVKLIDQPAYHLESQCPGFGEWLP